MQILILRESGVRARASECLSTQADLLVIKDLQDGRQSNDELESKVIAKGNSVNVTIVMFTVWLILRGFDVTIVMPPNNLGRGHGLKTYNSSAGAKKRPQLKNWGLH